VPDAVGVDEDTVTTSTSVKKRPRRNLIPFTLLFVLLVGSIVTAFASAGPAASAAQIVQGALVTSVGANSVAFTTNETISGSASLQVTATGNCDITSGICEATENLSGPLSQYSPVNVDFANNEAYIGFTGDIASQLPTPWISYPFNTSSDSPSQSIAGSNPLSALQQLAQYGAQVTDAGSVTLNGVSEHEYIVVETASNIKSQLNKLPSWMTSQLNKADLNFQGANVNVYINPQNQIAEVDASTTLSVSGKTLNVDAKESFSNYGVPFTVSLPPASEVTPISSLVSGL
jgi:hypothetical protein